MTNRTKVILGAGGLLVVFALGRYSVDTTPSVKTVEVDKSKIEKNKDKDSHSVTTVTTVKQPDGTTKITQVTETTTTSKSSEKKDSDIQIDQSITSSTRQKNNVSLIMANDFRKNGIVPIYGLSANREWLGPVTLGVFGLTNATIGLSIGVNF